MNDTREFLDRILKSAGIRFLAEPYTNRLGKDSFKHYPFESNADMAEFVHRCNEENRSIYHACAVYKEVQYRTTDRGFTYAVGRKGSNALAASCVCDDIDVGKLTVPSYDSQKEAAKALLVACGKVDIPVPMIVSSGVGLHLYWTLAESVAPNEWLKISKLKSACLKHAGLKLDPSRTEDIASILRPVGAKRHVGNKEIVVRILKDAPDIASSELLERFQRYAEKNGLLAPISAKYKPTSILVGGSFGPVEHKKVIDALARIDPNRYETWVTVAMCMVALYPCMGDATKDAWLAYSDRADEEHKRKNDVSGTDPEVMFDQMQPDMTADAALGTLMSMARDQALVDVEQALSLGDLSGVSFDACSHLRKYHLEALRSIAARYGLEVAA